MNNVNLLEFKQIDQTSPIFVCDLPEQIYEEVKLWAEESKKIKNHPLSELKAHENVGYLGLNGEKHNSYQCSISPQLIENSYWLGYVLRLCSKIFGGNHRNYKIHKWDGHFDGYDVWVNFSYFGDDNPLHYHPAGVISGVIYVQNNNHPIIFPDYNLKYDGKNGTMILFPSDVWHSVEKQETWQERISIAFNIIKK